MIALAGGRDVAGSAGKRSRTATWDELERARPDVVVAMPCGYDAERSERETRDHWENVDALDAARVVAVDASAYFSRPGPRLVDGLELLAWILHPDRVPAPPPGRAVDVAAPRPAPAAAR